ncbi:hypothetical protein Rs2_10284 [Raphanus sativus]|uniref:Probable glycosyltransferase STELLO1 n=1 Tax=Raphanus sativus TaxID=3726 RepID=A0A9W3D9K1_RAPSA|nr:probable glycosyltransferase STELLO1 [Raphanus sativus]KAJ4906626.1 hypothetical protein Rs2_10284 [Raphanus sativus]
MLVQDRAVPKPTKIRRFAEPKNLDFTSWVSENLSRIVISSLLIVTVASFFFLYNTTDTASLLCFHSQSTQSLQPLARPHIKWSSIQVLPDKTSPYSTFLTERWIVVSVTNHPTEELKTLVKIRGWQVLAVGNSMTPKDWSLKGSIFLSLDAQAELGYRVLDHLPYDSFVRKSVGYLFAIHHGAKKIYDADDRVEVIGGDLGKSFDVELVGEDPVLQYSHEDPNRTVVNPYVHFGQRSVWPRGLPLENVGEINHEEYYTEVFGGKQFIQQGVSNGLPDVDSVFYFTRKTTFEAFDVRFDEHAPKVALPQGVMVPVNSFNTLYHSAAFWGLMLPVSVSSMASDVIRGYWGQRLLWELGGYVAVYPPTAHRFDRVEAYPFAEEKDLHVNVGRLIKFLLAWRSGKHSFFETILDLSFAMAEEGFWTEQDLKFTADWLQDLITVGYQQPRLMSLELDRPRAAIGHGDRKEFVPRKLPSVHLGVEETGTVSSEIGNLIRWRKNFGNVVLVMFCSGPVERTALEWRLLYGRVFKTVVILSSQKNSDLYVEEAKQDHIYKHLPKIFDRYSSAEGFLFVEDDTVLNYWNLLQADKTKIWTTDKVSKSWTSVKPTGKSDWFSVQAELVKRTVSTMPAHFQVNYKEAAKNNQEALTVCSSEVFYVPKRYVTDFTELVELVGDMDLHYKVAVPMFFMSMDSPQNYDPVFGSMVYKRKSSSFNSSLSLYSAQAPAVHPWSISSEQDFIKLVGQMAEGDPLLMELV